MSGVALVAVALLTVVGGGTLEISKNSKKLERHPGVGIGVGNLPPDRIDDVLRAAHAEGIRLVDTAAASNNEHIIAATNKELDPPMSVETKVSVVGKKKGWNARASVVERWPWSTCGNPCSPEASVGLHAVAWAAFTGGQCMVPRR